MPKTKKPPRGIGEKPRNGKRRFKLPQFPDPQAPEGLSPLAEFIESCGNEVSRDEAVREYQREWCEHPRKLRRLVSTVVTPGEEVAEYTVACCECGLHKTLKGRPPKEVQ